MLRGSMILQQIVVCSFVNRQTFEKQPASDAIVLEVAFDFNLRTFVPVSRPMVCPIRDMKDSMKRVVKKTTMAFPWHAGGFGQEQVVNHTVIIEYCGKHIGLPVSCPIDSFPGYNEWSFVVDKLKDVRMQSSRFDSWQPRFDSNFMDQLKVIREKDTFELFLINSLRLNTNANLCQSRVVCIHVELGRELGEIDSFVEYHVLCPYQLLRDLDAADGVLPEQVANYRRDIVGILNSSHSDRVRVPVVFLLRTTRTVFVLPQALHVPTGQDLPIDKADQAADIYFMALQHIERPLVQSPSLP